MRKGVIVAILIPVLIFIALLAFFRFALGMDIHWHGHTY